MRSKDQLDQQREEVKITDDYYRYGYIRRGDGTRERLNKDMQPPRDVMNALAPITAALVYVGDCIRAHADAVTSTGSSIRHHEQTP